MASAEHSPHRLITNNSGHAVARVYVGVCLMPPRLRKLPPSASVNSTCGALSNCCRRFVLMRLGGCCGGASAGGAPAGSAPAGSAPAPCAAGSAFAALAHSMRRWHRPLSKFCTARQTDAYSDWS